MNTVYSIAAFNTQKTPEDSQNMRNLVMAAKSGDTASFGRIYDFYFNRIFKFIYYRVGHKETAEDITEDVFIKAQTRLYTIVKPDSFEGWLYQIARNSVIDHYRQKKVTVSLDEVENTLVYDINVIDSVNLQQQQKYLLKLIKDLSSDQQQVIKMKFFEGLENSVIAETLNKTEQAIRVIQHRALAKLKKLSRPEDNIVL